MELTPELAEVTGTLIGDGCLSKYFVKAENRFRWEIAFTGSADEFPYYSDFIRPVFQKYFGANGRLFNRGKNSTRFHVLNKSAFDFFANLGIPIGEKSHTVFIPKEILLSKELLVPCLRGVWDTDGSIYQRYSKQYSNHSKHYSHLKVLELKSASRQLLEDVHSSLLLLSIQPNQICKSAGCWVVYITKQEEIENFMTIIGFRNPHHLNRISKLLG